MEYTETITLKDGRTCILRNGTIEDGKAVLDKEYTDDYLRGWQMYNMLQLIGDQELARQYIEDPENFPRPELDEQTDIPDAA